MKTRWALAPLLSLLLFAGGAQAAINGAHAFSADYGFMQGFDGDSLTIISGAMEAEFVDVSGAFGFFNTTGVEVAGLDRVCWTQNGAPDCESAGSLSIRTLRGGSIGLDFPGAADGTYTAAHALAMFVDYHNDEDLNSFDISATLTAPAIDGRMVFGDITPIPFSNTFNLGAMGGAAALDDATTLQVVQDGQVIQTFQGKSATLSFDGAPRVGPFASDFVVLPFERDSTALFAPAAASAASQGLEFDRINQLTRALERSNAGAGGEDQPTEPSEELKELEKVLVDVLNGAVLRLPTGEVGTAQLKETFAVLRFDTLRVEGESDDRLSWQGAGPLVVQNGKVAGAPNLIGFGFFSLPWWSFLLWGIALGVWITRLVIKPPKEHPTWDRFKWAGWVFSAVALVVLFILWDFEVRAVWGTSLFTTEASGTGLWVTLAVQLAPLFYILFAVAAPLRLIFRNGLLLGRQGTFMGLSGGVAYLLAYALGATLLLSYLELIIDQVLESTGG